jgi:general secretion pathway protein F
MTPDDLKTDDAYPSVVLVRRGLGTEDLVALNEEIAGMARAGLPLDQGLAALARELRRGRLQRVTAELAADLHAGHTLPEALARQAGRVPPYYAALVTAAVRSARVGDVLTTLTAYARAMADLRAAVIGALLYPSIVFLLGLGIVVAIAYFLVPQFEQTFFDFRMVVPPLTVATFALCRHPLLYFVLPPALLAVLLLTIRQVLRQSAAGRRLWARWLYALPLVGTLLRAARLAGFTDLLAILVEHKVPLPDAFQLAGAASSDPLTMAASRLVEADLRKGLSLAEGLRNRQALPDGAAWMVAMGERRGHLAPALRQVAEMYRRQAELRAGVLRSVLAPLMLLGTSFVIFGLFVLAIVVPLFDLLVGLGMKL